MEPEPSQDIKTLLANQELLAQISTNLLNAERTFGIFSPQYATVLNTFFEFLGEMDRNGGVEGLMGAGGNADADAALSRAMGGLELKGSGSGSGVS